MVIADSVTDIRQDHALFLFHARTIAWRNIDITLLTGVFGVNAFHEKAGRSQVGSFIFIVGQAFFSRRVATVATLPSTLSMSDLFARCKLGVLVSAGAAT